MEFMNSCLNRHRALTLASLPMGSAIVTRSTTWVLCISSGAEPGLGLWNLSSALLVIVVNFALWILAYSLPTPLELALCICLASHIHLPPGCWFQCPEATGRQCQTVISRNPGASKDLPCSPAAANSGGPQSPWVASEGVPGVQSLVVRTRCLKSRPQHPLEATEGHAVLTVSPMAYSLRCRQGNLCLSA